MEKKQYLVTFILDVTSEIEDPEEEVRQMLGRMESSGFIYSYSGKMDLESREIVEMKDKETGEVIFSGSHLLNPRHWIPRNK